MTSYNIKAIVTDGLALCLDAASTASYRSSTQAAAANAQVLYTSEGAHTFTVPDGVTDISAVCIGGGGGGGGSSNTEDGGGGGGGAMAWGTITVTPKETLDVTVGEGGEAGSTSGDGEIGGDSKIERSGTVLLQGGGGEGGEFTISGSGEGGEGGTSSGTARLGGGEGGNGANGSSAGGGGGGAGGYEGNGGNGGTGSGSDGSGGGGGGGGGTTSTNVEYRGGGVGVLGEHDPAENGEGGEANELGNPGSGGSTYLYGGGGGGCYRGHANSPTSGGIGAVRIVYKSPPSDTRIYPALANVADTTYNPTNQSWNDLVGSNNGTLTGGVYWSDNAFIFNGTTDYISLDATTDIQAQAVDWTWEAWFYIDSGASSYDYLFAYGPPHQIAWYDNQLNCWFNNTDNTSSYNVSMDSGTDTVPTGQWTHGVISRISNTWKMYINAVEKGSITTTFTVADSSTAPKIGSYDGSQYFLDGKIGSTKIYKGKGLTAAEILQHYNSTKGLYRN